MRASVRKLGNSAGVIIPKSMLTELGLSTGEYVDMALAEGRLILVPVKQPGRTGWAEASRAIAAADDDALAWPEFADADDVKPEW
jgi:antitoxin MazE